MACEALGKEREVADDFVLVVEDGSESWEAFKAMGAFMDGLRATEGAGVVGPVLMSLLA